MKFEYEMSKEEEAGLEHAAAKLKRPLFADRQVPGKGPEGEDLMLTVREPREETPEEAEARGKAPLVELVRLRLAEMVDLQAREEKQAFLDKVAEATGADAQVKAQIEALLVK